MMFVDLVSMSYWIMQFFLDYIYSILSSIWLIHVLHINRAFGFIMSSDFELSHRDGHISFFIISFRPQVFIFGLIFLGEQNMPVVRGNEI